jgi:hypothetical protein
MPILGNARQELYCKHRASSFIPKKAALAAGYATGSAIYTSLEQDPQITARIQELIDERRIESEKRRAQAAAEGIAAGAVAGAISGVDHAWVLLQLKENARDAAQHGDFKESTAALKLIGDHLGMFKTSGGDVPGHRAPEDEHLSMDQIDKLTQASEHLMDRITAVEVVDVDMAMSLIEGHPGAHNLAGERVLDTGSETDVALQQADAIDAEFEEIETP